MASPTTEEMDHITAEERNALIGYCEIDESWWRFLKSDGDPSCPKCGALPSHQVGFQVMTQRSFQLLLHGKKKIKNKR